MSLTIELPPDLEQRLRLEAARKGESAADYVVSVLDAQLEAQQRERDLGAVAMMKQWLAEPPNEEDERWPEIEAALGAKYPTQQ
jgi:plasmid stability protein